MARGKTPESNKGEYVNEAPCLEWKVPLIIWWWEISAGRLVTGHRRYTAMPLYVWYANMFSAGVRKTRSCPSRTMTARRVVKRTWYTSSHYCIVQRGRCELCFLVASKLTEVVMRGAEMSSDITLWCTLRYCLLYWCKMCRWYLYFMCPHLKTVSGN